MKQLDMMEAMEAYEQISEFLSVKTFALSLGVSLLAAFAAVLMYRSFYENRGTGSQIHKSFPLLSLAVTTLFLCIQVSIPLSLGLLGSLSIIRFRTPVKEPEEVGFIMLVIASSVAAATFHFAFITVMLMFALVSLCLVRFSRNLKCLKRDGMISLCMKDSDALVPENVEKVLSKNLRSYSIQSSSSRDGITTMQITFNGLVSSPVELQSELRHNANAESVNVFLDRPGGFR